MAAKMITLSLPPELLILLDGHIAKEFNSRTDFIRRAVINQIRAEQGLKAIFDRAFELSIEEVSPHYMTDRLFAET